MTSRRAWRQEGREAVTLTEVEPDDRVRPCLTDGAATGRGRSARTREGGMITILDLKAEFAKLALLRGRTPQMTEVERKASGAFATLAPFRDGNIYSAKFSGDGAWERH